MAKQHKFTSLTYPQLTVATGRDADGKVTRPGASFRNGELVTDDAATAKHLRDLAKAHPEYGIEEGALEENAMAPELTALEDLEPEQLEAMAEGMGLEVGDAKGKDLVELITAAQEEAGRRVSVSPAIRRETVGGGSVGEAPAGGTASRGDPDASPILDSGVGDFPAGHPDRPVDSDGQPIPVADDLNPDDPAASR